MWEFDVGPTLCSCDPATFHEANIPTFSTPFPLSFSFPYLLFPSRSRLRIRESGSVVSSPCTAARIWSIFSSNLSTKFSIYNISKTKSRPFCNGNTCRTYLLSSSLVATDTGASFVTSGVPRISFLWKGGYKFNQILADHRPRYQ